MDAQTTSLEVQVQSALALAADPKDVCMLDVLPREILFLVLVHRRSPFDICRFGAAYRPLHDMLADRQTWRALCHNLVDVVAQRVFLHWTCAEDWKWVYMACTLPLHSRSPCGSVGTVAYYRDPYVYCGRVERGMPNGYGTLILLSSLGGRDGVDAAGIKRLCVTRPRPTFLTDHTIYNTRDGWLMGQWTDGVLVDGRGAVTIDGYAYSGGIRDGRIHGHGTHYVAWTSPRCWYEGMWYMGLPHGSGIATTDDGRRHPVEWIHGMRKSKLETSVDESNTPTKHTPPHRS